MSVKEFKSNIFTVTTTQPEVVERGNTARFKAEFQHIDNGLIDPSPLQVRFYEDDVSKDSKTPTKDSTGIYHLDFCINTACFKAGTVVVEWSGSYKTHTILVRRPLLVKVTR